MSGEPKPNYGCTDYREEMRLLGLKRRLEQPGLTEDERRSLLQAVEELERKMGM